MTGWRTSLRIAAREARRARGRTAMVLLLIALPVFGLAFAAVTYDMFKLRPAERVDRELGTAEARIHWYGDGPVTQDVGGDRWEEPPRDGPATAHPDQERLLAHLPPGSTATPYAESWMDMRTAAGIGGLEVIGVDAGNPLARGIVTVREGRPPAAADEVGLSARAMKRLGTRLGGTVEDAGRTRTFRVVALVESPANLGELMVRPTIEDTAGTWLVHTPQPMRWADVRRLNAVGMVVRSRSVLLDPPANPEGALVTDEGGAQDELGIAAVVGGLALVEVVLLAGPAFAIGARRAGATSRWWPPTAAPPATSGASCSRTASCSVSPVPWSASAAARWPRSPAARWSRSTSPARARAATASTRWHSSPSPRSRCSPACSPPWPRRSPPPGRTWSRR